MLSHFSGVRLFATLWTVHSQAPLSTGFSRQEYWSGLSSPPPGDLPHTGITSVSLKSPALADRFYREKERKNKRVGQDFLCIAVWAIQCTGI